MSAYQLVTTLLDYRSKDVFNPWAERDVMDRTEAGDFCRRVLLRLYLSEYLRQKRVRFLMIGEAPGYQGCRFTGIPFTSERILIEGGVPGIFEVPRITTRPRPWSEPSATVIWGALRKFDLVERAMLWNTFAWHPHKPGNPYSNRTPTRDEIDAGIPVLKQFLGLFEGAHVIAIGKTAERTLQSIGVKLAATIRHPANGGAKQCADGISDLRKLL